jgi:4-methyl-5(b-hydroxyethyl)-thiazole monophosphate biosynthesis
MKLSKTLIVLLAEGFEEIEALTPVDYMQRAGIRATLTAVGNDLTVTGSRGIKVIAEFILDSLSEEKINALDGIIVPGGLKGSDNLAASKKVQELLVNMAAKGKLICSICAAPARVLAPLGLLAGKKYTCYPGEEEKVPSSPSKGANWKEDRVVVDGNLITSRGPGTAGEWSCAIIEKLLGEAEAKKIADKVIL